MIEKIPDQIPMQRGEWGGTTFDITPKETFCMVCRKINEIVDAVNDITDWIKRTDETIVKYGIKPIPENIALSGDLKRTREMLRIAVNAIETIKYSKKSDAINLRHKANKALIEIYKIKDQTALEQKDVK